MRYWTVPVCMLAVSMLSVSGEDKTSSVRPATANEIEQLFNLAVASMEQPDHVRFVADLTVRQAPWTGEQIAAEVKAQNEMMRVREANVTSKVSHDQNSLVLSNAIARSESGVRLFHVQEWYSGKKSRVDQTDETVLNHPTTGYHETFVNLHDPAFSPYTSFTVDHQLHSALLTKDPNLRWPPRNLWRGCAMDDKVATPLLLALETGKDFRLAERLRSGEPLRNLQIDSRIIQQIHNNSDPNWHLEATDAKIGDIPVVDFKLEGQMESTAPNTDKSLITAEYRLGQQFGRTVCFRASITNATRGTYFFSERENFASNGYPKVWKTTSTGFMKSEGSFRSTEVIFKEIDLSPKFTDQEAFAPRFPADYTVSDVTSGKGVILQGPYLETHRR